MGPIKHIRKSVLKLSQADLGDIAGVTQATVSRWEKGELEPSRDELLRIRNAAIARGLEWSDGWFFKTPSEHSGAAA